MKSLYRSFAGGEITPEMFGRIDLTKFQTGLRRCVNFITLPHGPAARRPGFQYVNAVKDSDHAVRLIPFAFSATQAVILEFGHQYVRFHTEDGTLLEAAQSITSATQANPGVFTKAVHGLSNGDWIYLTDMVGMSALGNRFFKVVNVVLSTFQLADPLDPTSTPISTAALPAFVSGNMARVYTLASPYSDTHLFGLNYAQNSDVLTLTSQSLATRELRRNSATNWAFSTVSFTPALAAPGSPGATETVAVATNLTPAHYKITAVAADLVTESLASADAFCSNNLTLAGNFNTITWAAVTGANRYYVYKQRGGTYGYIGQTTTLSLVDDNILADTLISPPEDIITLNTGAGDFPGAVTYHERRRWFAGTSGEPQNMWATRNGTESNLTASIPSRDDDGMEFRIANQQQNAILHLVSLVDLVALTTGGEFRVFADGGPAISPTTISIKPQAFNGAGAAQPALATNTALYVQAKGSHIRELAYDANGTGGYRSLDVSIMAPHLFDGYTIAQLAFTRAPESALWAVRSDGTLLGMTYVPEQQVYGWHQHTSPDTVFESCAAVPETAGDTLYVVARRTLGENTYRFIERMAPRLFTDQAHAFHVDAGLTYDGAPTTTITGAWHLEGQEVQVLADGAVVSGRTIVNGTVTPALEQAASVVHVGLGYSSDLVTLPQAYEGAPASGQGTMKNVSKVFLRVTQSSAVKAGPTFDKLHEYPARAVSDPYGSPPSLQTAELGLSVSPSWNTDGAVCVRQDLPLPLTVVALALETQVGGG